MFSVIKFIWIIAREFPHLLNIERNALKQIPDPTKYLAMILLSCFWCLAFGIYIGELFTIGYNMIGHIAIISMVFVTWWTFKNLRNDTYKRKNDDFLRMPDRSSRCDEYTDEQRKLLSIKLGEFK